MNASSAAPAHPAAAQTRIRSLVAAIGSICVVGLASGLTLPLVSLRLSAAHASAAVIVTLAALPALGTIGISLGLAALTRALGSKRVLVLAVLLSCASVLILAMPYAPLPWMLSRLALGVSAGVLFALGEARILEVSGDQARGRWMGVYAMMLTACQFAGPTLLAALGTQTLTPLLIAAALHLVALALLLRAGWHSGAAARLQSLRLRDFVRDSLPLAAAVLFFSMFDSAVLSLLPLYGLQVGLSTRLAVLMVTAVLLGDSAWQVPLGWAADRFGRYGVHAACGLLTAALALALPLGLLATPAMWIALFLMGGAAGGLYTLAIVQIGDRYSGGRLIGANALVGLLWGFGALLGPVLAGAAMQAVRPHGLLLFVAAGAGGFLLSLRSRTRQSGVT